MAHSRKLRQLLDAAERRIRAGKGIRNDDFWEELANEKKKGRRARGKGARRSRGRVGRSLK